MTDHHTRRFPDTSVLSVWVHTYQILTANSVERRLVAGGSIATVIVSVAVVACVGILPASAVLQLEFILIEFVRVIPLPCCGGFWVNEFGWSAAMTH